MNINQNYQRLYSPEQLKLFLNEYALFMNELDVETYTTNRLQSYSNEDILNFISSFRVIVDEESKYRAGCFLFNNIWINDLFYSDEDNLGILLENLKLEGINHGVHLGQFSRDTKDTLTKTLTLKSYDKEIDYMLTSNLVNFTNIVEGKNHKTWDEKNDELFKNTYHSLTNHPYPWETLKNYAGGGEFCPNLWLINNTRTAMLAINQPQDNKSGEVVFNIVFAQGESVQLTELLRQACQEMSSQAPTGILNAHANDSTLKTFTDVGFEIIDQTDIFLWSQSAKFY